MGHRIGSSAVIDATSAGRQLFRYHPPGGVLTGVGGAVGAVGVAGSTGDQGKAGAPG